MFVAENRYAQALPFLLALSIGVLVLADPYISHEIAKLIPRSIAIYTGTKIPYLFTSLMLIVLILGSAAFYAAKKIIRYDTGKIFIICCLIGYHTVALSPIPKINGGSLTLSFFFAIILVSRLVDKQGLKVTILDFLTLCLMAGIILSMVSGMFKPISTILSAFLVMTLSFLIVNYCSDIEMLKFIIKWFIIFSCISAVLGILQEVIYYFYGVSLVGFIPQKQFQDMFKDTSLGTVLRVPALTSTYMFLAYFLAPSLILILNILFYIPLDWKRKLKLYGAAGIISIGIILTFSRFTMLALAMIIPLIFIIRWTKYILHMIIGVILIMSIMYAVVLFFHKDIYKKVYQTVEQEVHWGEGRIRLQLDKEGLYGYFYQNPWIGRGAGLGYRYCGHFRMWGAHNAVIAVADDAGILGLIPYLLLIVYSVIKALMINLRVQRPEDKGIARGILLAFLTIIIMIQFDMGYLGIVLWFFMGIIKAAGSIFLNPAFTTPRR